MTDPRLVNLLGALSLALADAQTRAVHEASGLGSAACAAINTLAQYPDQTIRQLATIAGLTHSVMVRTVDALVRDGLATKGVGADKREALVRLTAEGETARTRLAEARTGVLARALTDVPFDRQEALVATISDMLSALTETRPQADYICRLCDEATCGQGCPVERRAKEADFAASIAIRQRDDT